MARARRALAAAGLAVLVIGAIGGALLLLAGPAPQHPYFDPAKGKLEIIAHRGGAALRPENTLQAFEHAARLGADVLEMDVRATADGAFVVVHDATVDRTTDGSGAVAGLTLAELRRLDAGYHWSGDGGASFPYRGRGVRVATLDEVFARLPAMRMVVEMKPLAPSSPAALCALVRRAGMQEKVLVASFATDALREFRGACPEVATSMSAFEARLFAALGSFYTPSVPALQVPDRLRGNVIVTPELVERARDRGLKLHVWVVNDEARMRELISLGIDGIMTDRPDLLRGLTPPSSSRPTH